MMALNSGFESPSIIFNFQDGTKLITNNDRAFLCFSVQKARADGRGGGGEGCIAKNKKLNYRVTCRLGAR